VLLFPDVQFFHQFRSFYLQLIAGDVHPAHPEPLAFGDGDLYINPFFVIADDPVSYLGGDEPVVQIEGIETVYVLLQFRLFQKARVGEEIEKALFRRLHDLLEFIVPEGTVAFEGDLLDIQPGVFLDGKDHPDVFLPFPFYGVRDLGVEIALVVIQGLDLFHGGGDLFLAQCLTGLEGQDRFDVFGIQLFVPLDLDIRDESLFFHDEGDGFPFRGVGDIGGDIVEIAKLIDRPDIFVEIGFRIYSPWGAFEDLTDGAVLNLFVSLEPDGGNPLGRRGLDEDVPPQLSGNGQNAFRSLALGGNGREILPRRDVEDPHVHIQGFPQFRDRSRYHISRPDRFPHGGDRFIVGLLPRQEGQYFPLFDYPDVFSFSQFPGQIVVKGILQKGRRAFTVDREGDYRHRYRLGRGCRRRPDPPQKSDQRSY